MAGYRLPLAAHLLVIAMNEALGAVNHTVELHRAMVSKEGTISELAGALNAGQVQTLVILGGNPAYNAPVDLAWPQAQARAKTVVRLGYYEDETSWNPALHADVQWDLPAAHYLEAWGDARTADGTIVPIQPLIEPLFGGLTELEVLALIGGLSPSSPYEIVRQTYRDIGGNNENNWRKFLHDGFLAESASPLAAVQYDPAELSKSLGQLKPIGPAPGNDKLDVVFYRDAKMDDGRHNNNGWLQELPDPITKLTWDNAVLLSPKTAGIWAFSRSATPKIKSFSITPSRSSWAIAPCAARFGSSPAWRITPSDWRWVMDGKRPGASGGALVSMPTLSAPAKFPTTLRARNCATPRT